MPTSQMFLLRAQGLLLKLALVYVGVVVLIAIPPTQTNALYMHRLRLPWWSQFDTPEKYSLAPSKTVNMNVETSDGLQLGAWFVYSDPYFTSREPAQLAIKDAVASHPTILFLHGNAATRAAPFRVHQYQAFSNRLHTNVFAIDYRGFGDSHGTPSEPGLTLDALAAWNWLLSQGAAPSDILVVGISLGTGVTSNLAAALAKEGIQPRGITLLAPFSDIVTLLPTYSLFGFVPLLKPLATYPFAFNTLMKFLNHPFRSIESLPKSTAPILLVHSEDDWDIPCQHSETLFNALMESLLPDLPDLPKSASEVSKERWDAFMDAQAARKQRREGLIVTNEIPNFARVSTFMRAEGARVTYIKTKWGGHDRVGLNEGVQDIMKEMFALG